MRKLIFSINVSIDDIADHTVAVAADDELHDFYTNQLDSIDTVLFGRVTYQLFESYWPMAPNDPAATKSEIRFADKINNIKKNVFSRTLQEVHWNNTSLIKDNIIEEVLKMKQQPGKDLSVGGISTAQTFIKHGLIDEYWLLVQPVVWGKGKRLFDNMNERINLKLIGSQIFKSGVVANHYVPSK